MLYGRSLFLSLLFGFLFSTHAFAWNAYHLYNKDGHDIWAIECADGTLHSYAGSSSGLSTVGPALCEGHGGIANPNDGDPYELPAKACKVTRPSRPGRNIGGR